MCRKSRKEKTQENKEEKMSYKEFNADNFHGLDEVVNDLLNKGYLRMVKLDEKGEVLYQVTEKGKKYLEELKHKLRREKNGD